MVFWGCSVLKCKQVSGTNNTARKWIGMLILPAAADSCLKESRKFCFSSKRVGKGVTADLAAVKSVSFKQSA